MPNSKLPWMKLWFEDLDSDCGALSLAGRGAWMWILGDLHNKDGERTLNLDGWSRVIRASLSQTATVLAEIINTKTCDSNIENASRDALLQKNDALITVKCRRIAREVKQRKQSSLRQRRYNDRHKYNAANDAAITPIEADAEADAEANINTNARGDKSPVAYDSPVFIQIPLVDKSLYPICQCQVDEWKSLYPAVDIEQELRNYLGWCGTNPTKRKTKRGILSSVNYWLQGKQDKGHPQLKSALPFAKPDVHSKNQETFNRLKEKYGTP